MANLRDQLLAIREEHGRLTPKIVVEAARPENHPLHGSFEWDDSVAAQKWREDQAGWLIRHVKITYKTDPESPPASVRAFHATYHPEVGRAYDPLEEILDDPFQRQLLLSNMQRDWVQMKERYESLIEFWTLIQHDIADTGS